MLDGTNNGNGPVASRGSSPFNNSVSGLVDAPTNLLFQHHSSYADSSDGNSATGVLGFGCQLGGTQQHGGATELCAPQSPNSSPSHPHHAHLSSHSSGGAEHAAYHHQHRQQQLSSSPSSQHHHHQHQHHHSPPEPAHQHSPSHHGGGPQLEHHASSSPAAPLPSAPPPGSGQSLVAPQHHHHAFTSHDSSLDALLHRASDDGVAYHQQQLHHALHHVQSASRHTSQQAGQLALLPNQNRHAHPGGVAVGSNLGGTSAALMPPLGNAAAAAAAFMLASPSLLCSTGPQHTLSPQSLAVRGRKVSRAEPIPKSGFKGVSWNTRMKAWLAFYTNETGDRKSKTFSTRKLGMEEARMQAITFCRQKQDQRREARKRNRELQGQQCGSVHVLEKLSSDDSLVLDSSPGSLLALESWGAGPGGADPGPAHESCGLASAVQQQTSAATIHAAAGGAAIQTPVPSSTVCTATNHIPTGGNSGSLACGYLSAPPPPGAVAGPPSSMIGDAAGGGLAASPFLSSVGAGSPGSPGSPSRLGHTPMAPAQGNSEIAYVPIVPIAMDMIEKSGLLQPLELNVLPPCQHCNKQPYPFLMIVSEGQEHTYGGHSAEHQAPSSSQGELLLNSNAVQPQQQQQLPP